VQNRAGWIAGGQHLGQKSPYYRWLKGGKVGGLLFIRWLRAL
jgi:hypothetical protein